MKKKNNLKEVESQCSCEHERKTVWTNALFTILGQAGNADAAISVADAVLAGFDKNFKPKQS